VAITSAPICAAIQSAPGSSLRAGWPRPYNEDRTVKRAPAAVIAGGRPDGFLSIRIELAANQAGYQAAKSCADLVRPGREKFTYEADDPGLDPRNGRRNLQVVHAAVQAATDIILPGDAK